MMCDIYNAFYAMVIFVQPDSVFFGLLRKPEEQYKIYSDIFR